MNWKCKLFGHRLKPIQSQRLPDGSVLDALNVGVCEREGTIHVLRKGKAHWLRGGYPGAAYRVDELTKGGNR